MILKVTSEDNFLQIQSKLYSPIGDPSLYLQDIVFSKKKTFQSYFQALEQMSFLRATQGIKFII